MGPVPKPETINKYENGQKVSNIMFFTSETWLVDGYSSIHFRNGLVCIEDLLCKKPQLAPAEPKPAEPKPAPAACGACPYPPTSLEANRWYKEHGRR